MPLDGNPADFETDTSLAERVRYLEEGKCNVMWEGTKSAVKELATWKDGISNVGLAGVVGAAAGAIASFFVPGAEATMMNMTTAVATSFAGLTTAFIGTRGALQGVRYANERNAEVDHSIALEEAVDLTHTPQVDVIVQDRMRDKQPKPNRVLETAGKVAETLHGASPVKHARNSLGGGGNSSHADELMARRLREASAANDRVH